MTTESGLPAVPKKPAIKKLSHRHKRVLDFMIRNPELRLGEVAEKLNYTQAWVSVIVNSDLFQSELRRRREAFEVQDNRALTEKLNKAAHLGLDRLLDHIEYQFEEDGDEDFDDGPSFQEIKQVTELALKAQGYLGGGNKAPSVTIHNNQTNIQTPQVAQSTLETARARIIGHGSATVKPDPKALPSSEV